MACMLKTLPHTPLINTHKQTADSCHAGCWSDHRGGLVRVQCVAQHLCQPKISQIKI